MALIAQNNTVQFGSRDKILELPSARELLAAGARERESAEQKKQARKEKSVTAVGGKPLVELRNVNVSYGPRDVLVDINWTVREGERWVLSGHNGGFIIQFQSCLTLKQKLIQFFSNARVGQKYATIIDPRRSPSLLHGRYLLVWPSED